MARISDAQRRGLFGEPGTVRTKSVTTPWGIRVQVHVLVADQFLVACERAKRKSPWTPKRIDHYVNRSVRGSSSPSLHSYALAFDFFATGPTEAPPGGVWKPDNTVPPEFAAAFEELGFTWGAKFRSRADYPHIEWASAPPAKGQSQGQGSTTDSRKPRRRGKRMYLYRCPAGHEDSGKTFIADGITRRYVDDTVELGWFETAKDENGQLLYGKTRTDVPLQVHTSLKLVRAA